MARASNLARAVKAPMPPASRAEWLPFHRPSLDARDIKAATLVPALFALGFKPLRDATFLWRYVLRLIALHVGDFLWRIDAHHHV